MFKIIGADQQQYGPVSSDQVRQWIAEGRANAQTLVLAEGTTEWKALGSLPEFAEAVSHHAPPPVAAGAPPAAPVSAAVPIQPHVPNYLVQSIVMTLLTTCCCCLPVGLVALIYSTQVNSKLGAGDIPGATAASNNARLWCWIALACGIIGILVNVVVLSRTDFNQLMKQF